MPYLVFCKDSSNAPMLRKTWLQAHFDYISGALDNICVAGPTSSKKDGEYNGSCFIYNTDDLAEAETLFFNDPYYINGVYSSYELNRFVPAAGKWIGGKIW